MSRKNLIQFYKDLYIRDLEDAILDAMDKAQEILSNALISNLSSIPFKDNPVKILRSVSGDNDDFYETSDLQRKGAVMAALMDSIGKEVVRRMGNHIYQLSLSYISQNWQDDHIAIYYEHGTGSEWDGKYERFTTEGRASNDYRDGTKLASRSRHINYQGLGKGVWIDFGGNMRITGSRRAGRSDSSFMDYIGGETKAYHWFSSALKQNRGVILDLFKKALKKTNPLKKKYWRKSTVYTLGKD